MVLGLFLDQITDMLPAIIQLLLILFILLIVYKLVTRIMKKGMLKRAKTKKQKSNVIVFLHLWRYLFLFIAALVIIFSYSGSWMGLGLSAALLSAALGWALQKPISGVAAWIMIVLNKPFQIGDRIIVGNVKGDVTDITLTHIYLSEIGGTVPGEESSGRVIMIPNSVLFEKNIINYTLQHDYVLDEVWTIITFESDLKKGIKICEDAAKEVTKDFIKDAQELPYTRIFFGRYGIEVKVRYYILASERQRIASEITQKIFKKIKAAKGIEIAYPHTEVLFRKKKMQ